MKFFSFVMLRYIKVNKSEGQREKYNIPFVGCQGGNLDRRTPFRYNNFCARGGNPDGDREPVRNMMEMRLYHSALFDLYGALLTEKQRHCLTMYLFEDLSLSEIGDALGISRQAAYDTIRRGEAVLAEYEAQLGLWQRQREEQAALAEIYDALKNLAVKDEAGRDAILCRLSPFTARGWEVEP